MRVSEKITAFFIQKSIISLEDRQVYEYGFSLLLADMFNWGAMLCIGIIAGQLWPSIIYWGCFTGLRMFCGGYHAKTYLRCHCCTIGAFVVFLILNSLFQTKHIGIFLIGDLLGGILVACVAPIPHSNKPLSDETRKTNRKHAIALYSVLTIISLSLCRYNRFEGGSISLSLWIVSLCMIPAIKLDVK